MNTSPDGRLGSLRERRKAQTWQEITRVAARLALEGAGSDLTVEVIARESGISTRTFFNYFPTKEDAILGVRAPSVPELDATFLDGDGLLQRTSELLLTVTRSGYAGGGAEQRARLFSKYPQLLLRRRELAVRSEELVQQALTAIMSLHPDWSQGLRGHPVEDVARMLTTAAGVPHRYAVMTQGGMPSGLLEQETLVDLIELFRDLYRKLA